MATIFFVVSIFCSICALFSGREFWTWWIIAAMFVLLGWITY